MADSGYLYITIKLMERMPWEPDVGWSSVCDNMDSKGFNDTWYHIILRTLQESHHFSFFFFWRCNQFLSELLYTSYVLTFCRVKSPVKETKKSWSTKSSTLILNPERPKETHPGPETWNSEKNTLSLNPEPRKYALSMDHCQIHFVSRIRVS